MRSMGRSVSRLALSGFLLLSLGSCASGPGFREDVAAMSTEARGIFLAYYPVLSPAQRREAARIGEPAQLREKIRDWKLEDPSLDRRESRTLAGIEIAPDPSMPLDPRGPVVFKATLRYADGRSHDVTQDVRWHVLPKLGTLSGSTLSFGCVSDDLVVGADFLGERTGSFTLKVRRRIRKIEVRHDEAGASFNPSEFVKLKAVAHCEDGTSTEVSCQATWQTDSPVGETRPCGIFHALSYSRDHDQAWITAAYGGVLGKLRIIVPRIKPRRHP